MPDFNDDSYCACLMTTEKLAVKTKHFYRHRLLWTAWVGVSGQHAISSNQKRDQHPHLRLDTMRVTCRWHQRVAPTAGTLLTEVNGEDGMMAGGRTYILAGVCCRVWAQRSVRSNRGYIIPKYVLTYIFCMEKWRDREEAYAITKDML